MKYYYVESKYSVEEKIIIFVGLIIFAIALISNTKSSINQSNNAYIFLSLEWFESLIGIIIVEFFLLYCKYLFSKKRKNFKKWQSNLIDSGTKCNGYVKEVRLIKKNKFEFRVSYFSELYKKNIDFWTPLVEIKNLNIEKKILCDVFEKTRNIQNKDYDNELINVDENKREVSFSLNPSKLIKTVNKKYTDINYFDNKVAVNFYIKNND